MIYKYKCECGAEIEFHTDIIKNFKKEKCSFCKRTFKFNSDDDKEQDDENKEDKEIDEVENE